MRTHKIKLYSFEELNEKAKKTAIENWRLNDDLYHEGEMLSEIFKQRLSDLGYEDMSVEFSLSYSQGDGVAFYGEVSDVDKLAKRLLNEKDYKLFNAWGEELDISFDIADINPRYSHSNTMSLEINHEHVEDIAVSALGYEDEEDDDYENNVDFIGLTEKLQSFINTFFEAVEEDIQDIAGQFEIDGYAHFEEVQSDENISELLVINEYEFTEDGKMF